MAVNEDQWTVRGIPAEMRRQVAAAAEQAGMKVGAWVERALRAALERPEGLGGAGDLAVQLAAVIERVERLEAAILSRQESALDAVEPAGGTKVLEKTEAHPGASGAVGEMDVTGGDDGTRRRLTPAGAAKVDMLLRAGLSDAEIAPMFVVDRASIHQRRKKLEAKYGPGLGILPLELTRKADEMLKAGQSTDEILAILPHPEGAETSPKQPDQTSS